jgi:hypothetical protein
MITRCLIGVDVVVGIGKLPAAIPVTDIRNADNRMNGGGGEKG